MRRPGVKRIVGLGAIQVASNIAAFELFFDNVSFFLIQCWHLGATHFAYTNIIKIEFVLDNSLLLFRNNICSFLTRPLRMGYL
jgi:hypothetical protein